MEIKTFEESYSEAISAGTNNHLILGNGFSIGVNDKFGYNRLYDKAIEEGLSERIQEQFDKFGTSNFEFILNLLNNAAWLADLYNVSSKEMRADYENLKKSLVSAISKIHPADQSTVGEEKLDSCRRFIRKFDNIFTLNYDLLIYWAIFDNTGGTHFKDGFGRLEKQDPLLFGMEGHEDKGYLYYLHGGLHLFRNSAEIEKLYWDRTNPILHQVVQAILDDKYPIAITEGSSEDKMKWIQSNRYLLYCWRALDFIIAGTIFIYEHSLCEQDEHLLFAIAQNTRIRRVYVGLFGNPKSSDNIKIIAQGAKLKESRIECLKNHRKLIQDNNMPLDEIDVFFYQSESAHIWDSAPTQKARGVRILRQQKTD